MNPDPTVSFNAYASTENLAVLFLLLGAVAAWLTWIGTRRISMGGRIVIILCRLLLISALFALCLNPGKWVENREETQQFWSILVDRSLSMKTEDGDAGASRWKEALGFRDEAISVANEESDVETYLFDAKLGKGKWNGSSSETPSGESTDLSASVDTLLNLARNRADRFSGAILMSDGIQTMKGSESERVALRARAMEAPFYVLPIGGPVEPVDLAISPTRRQFVAFAGSDVTVSAKVEARGLGAIRPEVILQDADGVEIGREKIELKPGEPTEVRFTFPSPESGIHLLRFTTAEWEGERIAANNNADFTITVLDGTTRIFMAEGAPYWDSKFLAQMIRAQKNMDITSVFRLADDRFFRVETGDARPTQESGNTFPDSAEALAAYDLIVFGKGSEYFLDEKRIALLSEYVRDRGGAVLFTRGKPYRTEFEGLEFLESVKWGERIREPIQLSPTGAGEAAGLFGDLLPGKDDPVWAQLPLLEEAHQCLEMKPFTEVLLEGKWTLDGREQTIPILMSRRFGRGMTVTLNADGLWQWDFFPSEQGVEGQYEEFWSQLIQWAITFSEFLPGQDLSLHLDESIVRPGDLIRARVGSRRQASEGEGGAPEPALALYQDGKLLREIPAAKPGAGALRWEAVITLTEPGVYRVEALDKNVAASDREVAGPSLPITVLPPPGETEELSADPQFLEQFATLTGGRIIQPEEIESIVKGLSTKNEIIDHEKAIWQPVWDQWYWCLLILFIAATEWFTRRRAGLL